MKGSGNIDILPSVKEALPSLELADKPSADKTSLQLWRVWGGGGGYLGPFQVETWEAFCGCEHGARKGVAVHHQRHTLLQFAQQRLPADIHGFESRHSEPPY